MQMDQRPWTCFKQQGKKKSALVGTVSANCLPLRNCTAWRACLGPLNRIWPLVCWELRTIPNNRLCSGHGPNDRRSSSARRNRLEGLHAWPSNHGAPLPTAHLQHGAHQVTSALGWRSEPTGQLRQNRVESSHSDGSWAAPASSASLAIAEPWHLRGPSNCCARTISNAVGSSSESLELRALPPANLAATSSCCYPGSKTRDRLLSRTPPSLLSAALIG